VTLSATEAIRRQLSTVEAGGAAACLTLSSGPEAGRRLLLVRPVGGPDVVTGSLGEPALDAKALELAAEALRDPRRSYGLREVEAGGQAVEVFLEARGPLQELVIVGAGHIARPLTRMGAMLGFQVSVLDDRPDFATRERFPEARRLVRADFGDPFRDVPIHPGSHVLLVTRGHRYDYECLVRLMRMDPPPGYIGMIGSRRRVRATFVRLLDDGVAKDRLAEIHAPVGLDIKAETPEEIAVAVAAELVKHRRGGTGASLKDVERVAHRFLAEATPEATPEETT
jgi:xanthine dehydrogenase accessory factor